MAEAEEEEELDCPPARLAARPASLLPSGRAGLQSPSVPADQPTLQGLRSTISSPSCLGGWEPWLRGPCSTAGKAPTALGGGDLNSVAYCSKPAQTFFPLGARTPRPMLHIWQSSCCLGRAWTSLPMLHSQHRLFSGGQGSRVPFQNVDYNSHPLRWTPPATMSQNANT